jgi:hypothetical protein
VSLAVITIVFSLSDADAAGGKAAVAKAQRRRAERCLFFMGKRVDV